MPTRLDAASANAACDAVVDRVDVGGAGSIRVYSGSQPATVATAPTGTLLVTFTLPVPAFGNAGAFAAGNAALLGVPNSATAVAAGDPGWFRVINGAGASVFDGTVASIGSGGQLQLDATSVVTGQTVKLVSGSYAQPLG
jgi:hypothetical protein